ncbi:MAG TPA: ABC transporter permease subunit [Candidatus Saccharimonadales bacterium]|nr:ABC transporter permease subunit [Candidatus Saccharimonadales bacterium]
MKHLIWRVLKDKKTMLIVYCLVCIGFVFMYTAMFPSIKAQQATFNEVLKAYPQTVLKAMGIKNLDMSTISKFLTMEYFTFLWPLFAIMVAVTMGGFSIAGEIEAGTAPLLLSLPLSRMKIYMGKFLSSFIGLAGFTIVTLFIIWPIAKMFNNDVVFSYLSLTALSGFIFGLAVLGIASFFSAIFSEKGKAYFITGGILIVMYVLNVVSQLKDNFVKLEYFSLFHYFDPSSTLVEGQVDRLTYIVPTLLAVVLVLAGYLWFSRRNISI